MQALRALAGLGWTYHHLGRTTYADETFEELAKKADANHAIDPDDVIGPILEAAAYQQAMNRGAKAAAIYRLAATLKSETMTRRCTYLLMAMDAEGTTDRQRGKAHLNQLEDCAARMRPENGAGWAKEKRIVDRGIERWRMKLQ